MCIHVCVYEYVCVYMYVCMSMCVYEYTCMCVVRPFWVLISDCLHLKLVSFLTYMYMHVHVYLFIVNSQNSHSQAMHFLGIPTTRGIYIIHVDIHCMYMYMLASFFLPSASFINMYRTRRCTYMYTVPKFF